MKLKKYVTSLTAVILSAVFVFCGCSADSDNSSSTSSNGDSNITVLDDYIVENGRSDYKVVIGENANNMENYAAQELVSFIHKSSNVKLSIVSDDNITADFSGKYISIGDTSLSQKGEITVDQKTYTLDGYRIVTKDNTLILKGASGYGTLYSVYGFLEHAIGYHAYAVDELYFEKKNDIPLLDFNLNVVPDFEGRVVSFAHVFERSKGPDAARMKMYAGWQGGYSIYDGNVWPIWSHTARMLIPKSKYPEHYVGSGGSQPCVTSDAAFAVWLENLKQYIEKNPGGINFSIGLEDSASHCNCATCKQEANEHGGFGGVMVRFLNRLSDALQPWLDETFPGRTVNLVGLAYYEWDKAPTKMDESGKLVPYDETVVAKDNVGIMFAPISACWSHALNDPDCPTNAGYSSKLEGWSVVADKLTIWSYCTNFHNYFLNYNNWGSIGANYAYYKEKGVFYVFDQATEYSHSPMADLRIYLQSQLLWDTEQNVDDLIDDFMTHYYKVAAPHIRKYFDLTRAHYEKLSIDGIWSHLDCGALGNRYTSVEWSYAYCVQAMQCFEDAKKAVEISNLDNETKGKLIKRIDTDSTAVRYLILQNYSNVYSKANYNALVDEFAAICSAGGISQIRESGGAVSELISKWRKL